MYIPARVNEIKLYWKVKYFKTKFFPSQIIYQAPTPPWAHLSCLIFYFCLLKTVSHKIAQAQAPLKSVILLPWLPNP